MKDEIDVLNEILNIQIRYTKPLLKKDDKDYIIEAYENLVFKLKDLIASLHKENSILKYNAELNDKVVDKALWNEMIYKSRIDKANELIKIARTYGENYFSDFNGFLNKLDKILLNGGVEDA